jgi:hypothetical protein
MSPPATVEKAAEPVSKVNTVDPLPEAPRPELTALAVLQSLRAQLTGAFVFTLTLIAVYWRVR